MQDLYHASRYIIMSSNPTGFFYKVFSTFTFWGCIFSCALLLLLFCVLFVCFDFFCCCCISLHFFNITMKFQDASCPSLAVGFLSSSVEPPSQSLAVSASFLNVKFDRATFPFSIAQISSFELSIIRGNRIAVTVIMLPKRLVNNICRQWSVRPT